MLIKQTINHIKSYKMKVLKYYVENKAQLEVYIDISCNV